MAETRPNLFLSYARGDDEPFVKQLYQRLVSEGFNVWWDREHMPSRGLPFLAEIRAVIRNEVERVVVVFVPKCLTSEYCRAEWQAALAEGKVVTPLLRIGEYEQLPPELRDLHCPDFRQAARFEDAFRETVRILTDPLPLLGPLAGGVPDVPPHFQPRVDDLSQIAACVLIDEKKPVTLTGPQRATVLHGMGGTGKSVLAASFARSTSTRRSFSSGVYWLNAGEDTAPLAIMAGLGNLLGDPPQLHTDLATSSTRITKALSTQRALIVLDNAWQIEQIEPLVNSLGPSCRLLVTTRNGELATATGANSIELGLLSPVAALQHLADWAGVPPEALPPEAQDVARECGYLPFALALNGAMHHQGVSWSDLLTALRSADIQFAELRFGDYPYRNVFSSIKVSMDRLDREDPAAGERLRELVAFESNGGIPEAAIAVLWAHTAQQEPRHVSKTLAQLAARALIRLEGRPEARRVLIHDLQRDYLVRVVDAKALNGTLLAAYEQRCHGDWLRVAADGYFHQHLVKHLVQADRGDEVHRLLRMETGNGRNAWYEAKEAADDLGGYVADVAFAWRLVKAENRGGEEPLALLSRYALIQTSLNGLARALPLDCIVALVETGLWTPKRALATLRHLPPDDQSSLLVDLLPHLQLSASTEDSDELFTALAQIPSPAARLEAQVRMVDILDEPLRSRILGETLAMLGSLDDVDLQVRTLTRLWKYLSADKKTEVLNLVYSTLLHVPGRHEMYLAFQRIAPWLAERCDTAMALNLLLFITREQDAKRDYLKSLPDEDFIEEELRFEPEALEGFRIQRRGELVEANRLDDAVQRLVSSLASLGRLDEVRAAAQSLADEHVLKALLEDSGRNPIKPLPAEPEAPQDVTAEKKEPSLGRGELMELLAKHRRIGDAEAKAELLLAVSAYAPQALLMTGLDAVRQMADPSRRVAALDDFSRHVTQDLGLEGGSALLAMIEEIPGEEGQRWEVLCNVLSYLPKALRKRALADTFAALDLVPSDSTRAKLLEETLRNRDDLSAAFLQRALQTALRLEGGSLSVLSALTPHLPQRLLETAYKAAEKFGKSGMGAALLTSMALRLPPSYADGAYKAAAALENPLERADALANLASLPGRVGKLAFQEATSCASVVKEWYHCAASYPIDHPTDYEGISESRSEADDLAASLAGILRRLADACGPQRRLQPELGFPEFPVRAALACNTERCRSAVCELVPYCGDDLIPEIYRSFSKIEDPGRRFDAVAELLGMVPDESRQEIFDQALKAAEEVTALKGQVEVLTDLAPYAGNEERERALLTRALSAALQIQDSEGRAESLALIDSRLTELPSDVLFALWSQTLDASVSRTRVELLADIRASLPVVQASGGEKALLTLVAVAEEIWRWWP